MTKVLQKPASHFRELFPTHRGILYPEVFNKHFRLRCYEPSPELTPFVMYFWVQRWVASDSIAYTAREIFTGPSAYLFISQKEAFIHGIHTKGFEYTISKTDDVLVGVKFKPGGLYAFWPCPMSSISNQKVPLEVLFPELTKDMRITLLSQDDQTIALALNRLLTTRLLLPGRANRLIEEILQTIDNSPSLNTVEKVARHFKKSDRTLQELFQVHVGVGLKWVLMRNRLLQAAEYARTVKKPDWVQLAHELGYSSQPHFVSDFKRIVGETPSVYLRNTRSDLDPKLSISERENAIIRP